MKNPSILLCEDDPAIALMYQTKLQAEGFEVTVKPDGLQAWEHLTTQPAPDLVLLDIVMPKKDGFEILRDIRKHPTLHKLKVVLLTNLAQEVDRKEGAKLGASEYIVKAHTTPQELITKVKQYVSQEQPK